LRLEPVTYRKKAKSVTAWEIVLIDSESEDDRKPNTLKLKAKELQGCGVGHVSNLFSRVQNSAP